jgi:hypothetical protein
VRTQTEAERIAQNLVRQLGDHASTVAAGRAEGRRREGDLEGVRLWVRVAKRIEAILAEQAGEVVAPPQPTAPPRSFWRLMQRIERYRHRALAAEQKAATASDAGREELLDIAAQWRDLALQTQLMVEDEAVPDAARSQRRGSG